MIHLITLESNNFLLPCVKNDYLFSKTINVETDNTTTTTVNINDESLNSNDLRSVNFDKAVCSASIAIEGHVDTSVKNSNWLFKRYRYSGQKSK